MDNREVGTDRTVLWNLGREILPTRGVGPGALAQLFIAEECFGRDASLREQVTQGR